MKRTRFTRRVLCAAALAVAGAAAPARGAPVDSFLDLPAAIRSQVLTGAPRTSREIPASPYGAHTTMMEGSTNDLPYMDQVVHALSEAGYKWVMEATQDLKIDETAAEDIGRELLGPRLPHMVKYAALLQAHGITPIVRIDVPWLAMHIRRDPTEEDKVKIRAYVETLVGALSPYVRHWQYNNEPNMGNANPNFDPVHFVAWTRYVGEVVRELQSEAIFFAPGVCMLQCMAEDPYPWIPKSFAAGLLEPLDWFSYHPYRMPYVAANIPEHASEFAPWTRWGSYYRQVADLKGMIRRHNDGRDLPLAITEDGMPNLLTAEGEHPIPMVIGAKYELRRMLLDTWLGINPRVVFILFWDNYPNMFYDFGSSFGVIMNTTLEKKPAYYAAQNLMAVLDGSYERDDSIDLIITLDNAPDAGTAKLIRTEADAAAMTPGGMEGLYVQTYTKAHEDFDELLVFYWSAEPAQNTHVRRMARMTLVDNTWMAPLEINLMAMPDSRLARKQAGRKDLINPQCPERVQPRPLEAELQDGALTLPVEVRDYPMLIKWVRIKNRETLKQE